MDESNPTTAFVLSGGGSLGAVQAGMLRALYERGLEPDLIVGTSAGALNGGFVASRPPTPETTDELAEIWHSLGRGDIFPLNPLSGFLGFFGARNHLISERGLRVLIDDHVEIAALEDAPIPLHVLATDLLSGEELRLSEGDARAAILASAAIPAVFPPVRWHGRDLIDGGVSNNTPITAAIELGAERVYVLPTGNACALPEAPRGAIAMLLHATSLLIMRRLLLEVELLRDSAELIILPPPCPLTIPPIDFSHSEELIRRGHEDAGDFLDAVADGRAPVPLRMTMHDHRDRVPG
jgi:NTE family protein